MKIDARALFVPLVAAAVLALMIQQTAGALKDSGSWKPPAHVRIARPEDPYTRIDNVLGTKATPLPAEGLRNPFVFGSGRSAATGTGPVKPTKTPVALTPAAPLRPTLTSIISSDSDPRATVRYDGRDFSVRVNSLFADFSVRSITASEVVLDRGGETIVLSLRSKGE